MHPLPLSTGWKCFSEHLLSNHHKRVNSMLSRIQLILKTRKSRKEAINEKEEKQKGENCIALSHNYS